MTKMLVGRRTFCAAVLCVAALAGLLAVAGEADAVTKAARAKAAKVRAVRALKKPMAKKRPLVVFRNLSAIGIAGTDAGGAGGCFVRGVSGRARQAGIDPGDVITQIENTPVTNTADADDLVGQAIASGAADVVLFVTDVNTGAPNVPILVPLR